MVNTFKKLLVITICFSPLGLAFAQPPDDPPSPDPDADVPITGIELLVGAGALWGAFKALDKRKKQNS